MGEYVHIDVADDFSSFGKFAVVTLCTVVAIGKFWLKKKSALVLLLGAISMVLLRELLVSLGHGPNFDLRRSFVIEPMVMMFGNMLTVGALKQKGLLRLDHINSTVYPLFHLILKSMILSAAFTDILVVPILLESCSDPSQIFAIITGATIGSTLCVTGSVHVLSAMQYAYDDIGWLEFTVNTALPTVLAYFVFSGAVLLFIFCGVTTESALPGDGYLGVAGSQAPNDPTDDPENEASSFPFKQHVSIDEIETDNESFDEEHSISLDHGDQLMAKDDAGKAIDSVDAAGSSRVVLITVVLTLLFFTLGFPPALVSTAAGCVCTFLCRPSSTVTIQQQFPPLDIALLVTLSSSIVLVSSLNDTGAPQSFFNFTLWKCAEDMFGAQCLPRTGVLVAACAVIFSRFTTVMSLAATFPYNSPYGWVTLSFIVSIVGNIATTLHFYSLETAKVIVVRSALPTMASLFVGMYALSYFHFVPECSERLGECDGF